MVGLPARARARSRFLRTCMVRLCARVRVLVHPRGRVGCREGGREGEIESVTEMQRRGPLGSTDEERGRSWRRARQGRVHAGRQT